MRTWRAGYILAALAGLPLAASRCSPAEPQQSPGVAGDSAIRTILAERVGAGDAVGLVVGVLEPSGRRVVAYGAARAGGDGPPLGGSTVFEIGSVTKAFTGVLLAEMAARGEVALDDPIAKHLPAGVRVPSRNGKQITLLDLATHRSGLPRLPTNLMRGDPGNPYADYSVQQLYDFLASYELQRDPGARYEYSNLGAGLLGHALALRAGTAYEALLAERILAPLRMPETRIALTPAMRERLATGHLEGKPVSNWDLPTLAGAGALRSTADDLLTFLAAHVGAAGLDTASSLARALREAQRSRRDAGGGGMEVGLGWHILRRPGGDLVWHNGGTGGYFSFVGFDPSRRVGVVVLSNSTNDIGDIGFHLLDAGIPLRTPRKQVAVEARVLDAYVGRYQLAPTFEIVVTREGDQLYVQATGQPKLPIFPQSDTQFFLRAVDAQITFERNSAGVTRLILHQRGRDTPGTKVR